MSLVNKFSKKKGIANVITFDLENIVLNKYTDDRVSEVYIVGSRRINTEKLYSVLASGENYNVNDSNFLMTFLEKPKFFRSIKEFLEYLKILSKDGNCIAYAHNLDYELDYILKETNGSSIKNKKSNKITDCNYSAILRSNHAPISILLDKLPNVEFRCSYALTGYSIKTLGEMFKVPKLPYDYEKVRRATDRLSKEDYEYNDRDIVISGMAIIQKVLMRKETIDKLPLTTTSEMNNNKGKFITKNFGKETFNGLINKRKQQLDCINYKFYQFVMDTRQGGLTNLSNNCFNKVMKNVFSIDIASSYPDRMCNFKFPRYNNESYIIEGNSTEEIMESTEFFISHLVKGKEKRNKLVKGFFAWLHLENIKAKEIDGEIVPLLPLSINKCILDSKYEDCKNVKSINGKIISADSIDIKLNDIDYEQLLLCYDFEVTLCYQLYVSTHNEYLSIPEICFLFDLFNEKQQLKPFKDERKAEYMHIKGDINANYGRKQMEVIRPIYYLENGKIEEIKVEEILKDTDGQTCLENINDTSLSIDIPSDGCYISSSAKLKLIQMSLYLLNETINLNKKYGTNYKLNIIYCDTDSLKWCVEEKETSSNREDRRGCKNMDINIYVFTNILVQKIEKYNENIIENNKKNYRLSDYLNKFDLSITDKNVQEILKLGTFDIEHEKDKDDNYIPYKYFKSIGAKKYCTILGNKISTTIAGCSTEVGSKIKKYCDNNNLDYQETLSVIFNLNTVFDRSISGRTVSYEEKHTREEISNMVIDNKPIVGASGKMVENTSYTLGVTENDFEYLFNTSNINDYGRKEEDIIKYGRVLLECEDGTIVLLESEEEMKQYFIDEKRITKKYIYKSFKEGRLIINE